MRIGNENAIQVLSMTTPAPKRRTRGQGEGSIYRRASDGMWVSVVDLGWQNGKRSRKYLYGKTRAEAAEKLRQALHDQHRGLPVKVTRQTVEEFLERWLRDIITPTRSYGTATSYAQYVRGHIVPAIGHKQLAKLSPQDVQGLISGRLSAGLSPQTVRFILSTLHLALDQAERWDLVPRNVASLVDRPKAKRFEPDPLNLEEARRLLETVAADRLAALYEISVRLGLRQGEALGLRWRDVDLNAGLLAVRHSLQRVNRKLTLVAPKTERSRRTVDLTPPLVRTLEQHRERQHLERDLAGDRWRTEWELVFCWGIGTPLDNSNLGKDLKAHLSRISVGPRRWHDLRHTAATLMLSAGVPERVIMEIMGHSRLDMTRLYAHVLPPTRREAIARVDALLGVDHA
jgi:integrase